jgi:hypothetical protein
MKPRWFVLTSIAVICGLIAATFVPSPRQDIAVLDRLAPRIERAQTLAPETRTAIMQVVDRARSRNGDPRHEVRRNATIGRVTDALKARGGAPELSSVGQASRPK